MANRNTNTRALEALKSNKVLWGLIQTHSPNDRIGVEILLGCSIEKPRISQAVLDHFEEHGVWSWKKQDFVWGGHLIGSLFLPHLEKFRYFPKLRTYYLYNGDTGAFKEVDPEMLRAGLQRWLGSTVYRFEQSLNLNIQKLEKEFASWIKVDFDLPYTDQRYLCLKNGLFNKETRQLEPHTPQVFVTGACGYSYDPQATCPRFIEFIASFCENHLDRINLLRSFMWAVMFNYTNPQVFLYVSGPGATGKSVFAHVISAMLPPESVVSTKLRDLNTDKFEVINLSFKSLVVLNDAEDYTGDMSVLKAFVGQDILKGSRKYVQGTFKVQPTGILLVLANHPFSSMRDSGGALARRVLPFEAKQVSKSRVPLIFPKIPEGYDGPLWTEAAGILNWILDWDVDQTHKFLTDPSTYVPSIEMHLKDIKHNVSPLGSWVEDNLTPSPDSKVLVGTAESDPERYLYANYRRHIKSHGSNPVSHKSFVNDLKNHLIYLRWDFEYIRVKEGRAFTGISLVINVFPTRCIEQSPQDKEYKGSDSNKDLVLNQQVSLDPSRQGTMQDSSTMLTPLPTYKVWYDSYISYLNQDLNSNKILGQVVEISSAWAKDVLGQTDKLNTLLKEYLASMGVTEQDQLDPQRAGIKKIQTNFVTSLKKISHGAYGCTSYQVSSSSPRLFPKRGSLNANYLKKSVHSLVLGQVSHSMKKSCGWEIVDLDINSCYVSLVCAFWPHQTTKLRSILDGLGIWEYLKSRMQADGKANLYNKPRCKSGVYASYFGGSQSAMVSSILEDEQKKRCLSTKEWVSQPEYTTVKEQASQLASYLNCSDILKTFRQVSTDLRKWMIQTSPVSTTPNSYPTTVPNFTGPLGYSWPLDQPAWRNSYSCILQEIEILLVAGTVEKLRLEQGNLDPESWRVIMHNHDGVLLAVRTEDTQILLAEFNRTIKEIGQQLGAKNVDYLVWEIQQL